MKNKNLLIFLWLANIALCSEVARAASSVKANVAKPAVVVMTQYQKNWDYNYERNGSQFDISTETKSWNLGKGGNGFWDDCFVIKQPPYNDDSQYAWGQTTWDAQGRGTQLTGSYRHKDGTSACGRRDYPATNHNVPVNITSETCAGGAFRMYNDEWGSLYIESVKRTVKTSCELRAGYIGAKRESLFVLTSSAAKIYDMFYPEIDWSATPDPVPVTSITLGSLGALDTDGYLCAALKDNETRDVTPKVSGGKYYTYVVPNVGKYPFRSAVWCPALTDTNVDRTSLGVGEKVTLTIGDTYGPPVNIAWKTSGGTLSAANGPATVLSAPKAHGSATVTATAKQAKLTIDFGVEEPSGIKASIRQLESFSAGSVGAGMYIDVVVQPTTVSFSQIMVMEPSEPTTGITDYFLNVNLALISHAGHGADDPHPVNCGNLIISPPNNYFDHATSFGWPIGTQGGAYTWPIHPIWWVAGDTATHPLSGWTDQTMTLSSDGTMRVDKFGLHVTRHP